MGDSPGIVSESGLAGREGWYMMHQAKRGMCASIVVMVLVALIATPMLLEAGTNGNEYPNGVEGIKAASLPPPGVYLRTYTFWYSSDDLKDPDSNTLPIGFDVGVLAVSPRLIWVTDKKVLGGNLAFDVMVPIINTDLNIDALGFDESSTGIGDIYFSPLVLGWHGPRWDAVTALSFFAPTGNWEANDPTKAGKNYWTTMLTGGFTSYLDEQKAWSFSMLGRYEFHGENQDVKVDPGDDFHVEWGLGKVIKPGLEIGLAGYCQWQVTEDKGSDVVWDMKKDRVYAAGPELSLAFPESMVFLSFRALLEFGARDRTEGSMFVVTLTKRF